MVLGKIFEELSSTDATSRKSGDDLEDNESSYNPVLLGIGAAAFLLPHLAVLLSLPPVLRCRGAPYLPTFSKKMNAMFDLVRNHALHSKYMQQKQKQDALRFVDL